MQQRDIASDFPSPNYLFGGQDGGNALWKTKNQVINEYRFIFVLYYLYGDFGKLNTSWFGNVLKQILSTILTRPIPRWYDTHAKHKTALHA